MTGQVDLEQCVCGVWPSDEPLATSAPHQVGSYLAQGCQVQASEAERRAPHTLPNSSQSGGAHAVAYVKAARDSF